MLRKGGLRRLLKQFRMDAGVGSSVRSFRIFTVVSSLLRLLMRWMSVADIFLNLRRWWLHGFDTFLVFLMLQASFVRSLLIDCLLWRHALILMHPLTMEFLNVLSKVKLKKAGGMSRVTLEMILFGRSVFHQALLDVFRKVWRDGEVFEE